MGMPDDQTARDMLEQSGMIGGERFSTYNMIDYTIQNYSKEKALMNGCDFLLAYSPNAILLKDNTGENGSEKLQYITEEAYEQQNLGQEPDFTVTADEFNKYVDEFKKDKVAIEYTVVNEQNTVSTDAATSDNAINK